MKLIDEHIRRWGRGNLNLNVVQLPPLFDKIHNADVNEREAYLNWLNAREISIHFGKTSHSHEPKKVVLGPYLSFGPFTLEQEYLSLNVPHHIWAMKMMFQKHLRDYLGNDYQSWFYSDRIDWGQGLFDCHQTVFHVGADLYLQIWADIKVYSLTAKDCRLSFEYILSRKEGDVFVTHHPECRWSSKGKGISTEDVLNELAPVELRLRGILQNRLEALKEPLGAVLEASKGLGSGEVKEGL